MHVNNKDNNTIIISNIFLYYCNFQVGLHTTIGSGGLVDQQTQQQQQVAAMQQLVAATCQQQTTQQLIASQSNCQQIPFSQHQSQENINK